MARLQGGPWGNHRVKKEDVQDDRRQKRNGECPLPPHRKHPVPDGFNRDTS